MPKTGKLELSPKLDIVFKKLFTENEAEFRVFLSDMLGIPLDLIQKLEYQNTEKMPETVSEKLSRLDICLYVAERMIDVEIQVKNHHTYQQRSLFYWGRLYVSNLQKGENYNRLRAAITLNLLDYVMFPERRMYHAIVMPEFTDTHDVFSHQMEMHFVELPKAKFPLENGETIDKIERREQWLLFLNARTWEEMEMLENSKHQEIRHIVEAYEMLCEDFSFRLRALNRDMEIHDYVSDMEDSREEGLKTGREEGLKTGREEGLKTGREEGLKTGREEGLKTGREEGEVIGEAKAVLCMMQKMGMEEETACEMMGMDETHKERVLAQLAVLRNEKPQQG